MAEPAGEEIGKRAGRPTGRASGRGTDEGADAGEMDPLTTGDGATGDGDTGAGAVGQPAAVEPEQPEVEVMTVSPAWFASRPGPAAAAVLLGLAGISFGIFGGVTLMWPLAGAGAVAFVVAVGTLGYWRFSATRTKLTITNRRLTLSSGFLGREVLDIPVRQVQDIRLTQSFSDRLLGIGHLSISHSSQEDDELELFNYPDPQKIKKTIDRQRRL